MIRAGMIPSTSCTLSPLAMQHSRLWLKDSTVRTLNSVQKSGYQIMLLNHLLFLTMRRDAKLPQTANADWAKVGIMFRRGMAQQATHYSLFLTKGQGLAQQYRPCNYCGTVHHGTLSDFSSVWLRIVKEGNIFRAFYKPSDFDKHEPWISYGAVRSMTNIRSWTYVVGIAVTAFGNNNVASAQVSNIQLTRTCSSTTITVLQCDQASNCESGPITGNCYTRGEVPSWEFEEPVSNIFDSGSTVTVSGCISESSVSANRALDGTTDKYYCDRIESAGNSQPASVSYTSFSCCPWKQTLDRADHDSPSSYRIESNHIRLRASQDPK